METTRQKRVGKLLQGELSTIFQRELGNLIGNGTLVTVSIVRVTPDLSLARVYLSFLPAKSRNEKLETIIEHTKSLRQVLAQRVRYQLRIVPNLEFFIDDTEDEVARINNLLKNLSIPPEEKNENDE